MTSSTRLCIESSSDTMPLVRSSITGLIYRHHRPSYYSPSSRTALAEAELSYKENHVSRSVYVSFSIDRPSEELSRILEGHLKGGQNVGLAIWSTTAWSLSSNMVSSDWSSMRASSPNILMMSRRFQSQAIMVNDQMTYSIVEQENGQVLVVAEERLDELESELLGSNHKVLASVPGTFTSSSLID